MKENTWLVTLACSETTCPCIQREEQVPGKKRKNRDKRDKDKEKRQKGVVGGGGTVTMTQREEATMKTVHRVMRGRWLRRRAAFFFFFLNGRFSIGTTYLALAIVPPRPLVTQTNKTARTYHRGAVSDLGLDTAIFFKLDQVVERIPRPRAGETWRGKKSETCMRK